MMRPEISTTSQKTARAQMVLDPSQERIEERRHLTKAEKCRDKQLKSAPKQLESSLDISPGEIALMSRVVRGSTSSVAFKDESQGSILATRSPLKRLLRWNERLQQQ